MIEFRQLQCFVAVCEELHFGRAAKRLNMTQPPLSKQIQALESELNLQLLERTTRSVTLTPAGKVFLRDALQMLRYAEQARLRALRTARGESGPIRLGFTAGSGYDFLPKLLTAVGAKMPNIRLVPQQMTSSEQVEAFRSNELDVGLFRPSDIEDGIDKELDVVCVAQERLLLAVPTGHVLARGPQPDISSLAAHPFIGFSVRDGYYFHHLIDAFFTQHAVTPKYVLHVSQIHSILALVSANVGLSIVPASARELHYKGVIFRPLKQRTPAAELHFASKPNSSNRSIQALLLLAKAVGQQTASQ